jgi:protein tyrosine phosphatase (PTP) superfamily phosphohydrolase (DUF442 family)
MPYRTPHILCLLYLGLGIVVLGALPSAYADVSPEEPSGPTDIDQTPPLVPIPNARVSAAGLLVGGQPSMEQLEAIHQAGYRTVVSLRTQSEHGDEGERALLERLQLKFVSIPVAGPSGLTESNARALSQVLGERDALPAVVHCSTGQRAAALLGLEAFVVDRLPPQAAIDLAKRLGLRKLERALRERITAICKADASRNCEGFK